MGHQLNPRSRKLLTPAEVVDRLRREFAYVETDPEEGTRRALALADWIEARPAWIFLGQHAAWLERAKSLRGGRRSHVAAGGHMTERLRP